ncbi:MAG: class I SAM-dependent methyltransferase [Steroidobacterales bacterium]
MADAEQFNADQLAFWNGQGDHTWVARQKHTDISLAPVTEALLALAAPRVGERVLDVGCGCGASTLELARAVGPTGRLAALDISAPMLAEGQTRAEVVGVANVDWLQADAASRSEVAQLRIKTGSQGAPTTGRRKEFQYTVNHERWIDMVDSTNERWDKRREEREEREGRSGR